MKNYDMELIEEEIVDSIEKDILKRNKKMNKFIEIINNTTGNRIIAVDGKWGCGKTVFLKQLEVLNKGKIANVEIPNINKHNLNRFNEEYLVYYYNSWQNDNHESPLLSLLYNLINDFSSENQIASVKLSFDLHGLIKTLTKGVVSLDKIESFKDIAAEIYTVEEKKTALNRIINSILPPNKRMVFIIDELDRCRPDYAVNILETIKHFYTNDRIVFILGTNNEQLSHTITNYYGANFDGYGYLTKFYNLIIKLDDISPSDYLAWRFSILDSGHYLNKAIHAVCQYFRFQLRDINRLLCDFEMLNEYFTTYNGVMYDEDTILKFVFLPYCLGLKLKGIKLYEFIEGHGYELLKDYVDSSPGVYSIILYDYEGKVKGKTKEEITEEDIFNYLKEKYDYYFVDNTQKYARDKMKKDFIATISLIGDQVNI